jgi:hypothetical protein
MAASKIRFIKKKAGLFIVVLTSSFYCYSQDAYMADTSSIHGLFGNFVGIKFFAVDFGASSLNQDLQFKYTSYSPQGPVYNFQHDMNVTGITNFYNVGLGMEENLGNHLVINFFNASVGYVKNVWDWNIGAGVGYFISLNRQKSLRLNASLNVYYQYITYSFGDYFDTTQVGFFVNGVNVGTNIKNVKYVNDIFTISPGIELLYRRSNWDFYAGVYYNYVFYYHEKVNFYETNEPVSSTIYYSPYGVNDYVAKNVLNLNVYMFQVGIMREFGL